MLTISRDEFPLAFVGPRSGVRPGAGIRRADEPLPDVLFSGVTRPSPNRPSALGAAQRALTKRQRVEPLALLLYPQLIGDIEDHACSQITDTSHGYQPPGS